MKKRMRYELALVMLLGGCGAEQSGSERNSVEIPEASGPPVVQQIDRQEPAPVTARTGVSWERPTAGETSLRLIDADGSLMLSLNCGEGQLTAAVPSFTPIGSEDRFALGVGNEPVTLVADPTRQSPGKGVRAEGAAPENLAALFAAAGQVTALYGTQRIGPVTPPPAELVSGLAEACTRPSL